MKAEKLPAVHFVHNYLIDPTNPVTVNLIGAGGTGSRMLTALAEISHSLTALGHAGLQVNLFDDDVVTEANLGRQRFADAELSLYKSVALINRINRFYGTNWKAVCGKFSRPASGGFPESCKANLYISCVDTVAARYEIAAILKDLSTYKSYGRDKGYYWMDFGNSRYTGQVLLSTLQEIEQPPSRKYCPVPTLPWITEEFSDLLDEQLESNEPSCSLAEALDKQDLFINSSLAAMGSSLLWSMFRNGMTHIRGFFLNLEDYRTLPLMI